jgi:hypothetical protein
MNKHQHDMEQGQADTPTRAICFAVLAAEGAE